MAYSVQDLHLINEDQLVSETGALYLPNAVTQSWRIIPQPLAGSSEDLFKQVHRLNSLGSFFYFSKVVLGKKRFQTNPDPIKNLHFQMCRVVEKDGLKEVIEIPRDHFKSSVYSECFPIWRALPFTEIDEIHMRTLGYNDNFILWMRRAHKQDLRTLIISETKVNAVKLGIKVRTPYESNNLFKFLFPEIIPDSSCTWKDESYHQKRTAEGKMHGEGTFDLIGVGAALQSRHYDMLIQDDLVGRDAYSSETEMKKTIEYHQLLVGVMDAENGNGGRDNDEIVVGNRWSYNDLNSYIRTNEPYFNFTTHSALGGCCEMHPYGTPIFPEEQSAEKLSRWKSRLGTYLFSCQFLNSPVNPNEVKFKKADLNYYEFIKDSDFTYADVNTLAEPGSRQRKKVLIRHHVKEGDVIEDIAPRNLKRYMIVDPNHAENTGRCRHAITVTGIAEDPRRIYLLDVWAKACSIGEFIETMLFLATVSWKLDEIWVETIAAQRYLKYHLEYKLNAEKGDHPEYAKLKIRELKTPRTANAKKMRIDSLGPIFERGEFWVNSRGQKEFEEEFESYPSGKLIDVLDTLGYGPSVWPFEAEDDDLENEVLRREAVYRRNLRLTQTGY